ncbi:MAG: sulfite exporter TauE/SafE family protein [Gemmobacter sp.]
MITALILGAVLVAGLARAITGFGFALLAVPLLGLQMPLPEAVALTILLQVAMIPRDVATGWRHLDRGYLMRLLLGALPAIPLGQIALLTIPPDQARLALAALVVLAIVLRAAPAPVAGLIGRAPAPVAGAIAGLMAGLAAMPGPPVVLHALARPLSPDQVRATLVMFFGILSIISLPALIHGGAADKSIILLAVSALPALVTADWAGRWVARRLGSSAFRQLAGALLLFSACIAVYPALA